jgi:hypothetical protein
LWKWQKNPPGLPSLPNLANHPKNVKKIEINEVEYDIVDNPVTAEYLEEVEVPDNPDSLLVDQFNDDRYREFIHKHMETNSPATSYMHAFGEPIRAVAQYKAHALMRTKAVSAAMRQINVLRIRTFESQILPDVISYLSNVINADMAEFYNEQGKSKSLKEFGKMNPEYRRIIQEIDFSTGKEKLKLPDKTKAAALLAKVFGMYHESQITLNMTQNNFSVQQQKATEGQAILDNIVNGRDPMAIKS